VQQFFYILIFTLGMAAYVSAVAQILEGRYSPSFFSRGVWFLLGINSFAGVLLGGGSKPSIILALTLLIGNSAVFALSYKLGSRDFGIAEKFSLLLLIAAGLTWILWDEPFVGLIIGLVAHFIGGIPTIWRAIKRPTSEQAYHWYFFFTASLLSIVDSNGVDLKAILFPVYFVFFEGLIIILVNRKYLLGIVR
jgi:hypothetical protein